MPGNDHISTMSADGLFCQTKFRWNSGSVSGDFTAFVIWFKGNGMKCSSQFE